MPKSKKIKVSVPAEQITNVQQLHFDIWRKILKYPLSPITINAIFNTSKMLQQFASSIIDWEQFFWAHFPEAYEVIANQQKSPDWQNEFQFHSANSPFSKAELSLYAAIRQGYALTLNELEALRPVLPSTAKLFVKNIPYIFQVLKESPRQDTFDLLYNFILDFYKSKIDGKAYLSLVILCRQDEELQRLLPYQAKPGEKQYDYCNSQHLDLAIKFENLNAVKAVVNTLGDVRSHHLRTLQKCRSDDLDIAHFLLVDNKLLTSSLNKAMQSLEDAGLVGRAQEYIDHLYFHLLAQYLPEYLQELDLEGGVYCPAEVDGRRFSLIHTAAQYGHLELVRFLVEEHRVPFALKTQSLPLSIQKREKWTPLIIACMHDQIDVVAYLIERMLVEANNISDRIKPELVQALNYAIEAKSYNTISLLTNFCKSLTARDEVTQSRMGWIVHYEDKQGKDLKIKESPLSLAIQFGELGMIKELLSLKKISSLVNYPDHNGNTPLHLAVIHKARTTMHLLINAGANPLQTNKNGKMPIDLADKATKGYLSGVIEQNALATEDKKSRKKITSKASFFSNAPTASSSHVASSSNAPAPTAPSL